MKGNDFLRQGALSNLLSANTFIYNRIHDAKTRFCSKKKAQGFMPHTSSNHLMLAPFSFPQWFSTGITSLPSEEFL